jgi:hypothetical protein
MIIGYVSYVVISVSNSVLKMQYRGRYNTGISKMSMLVFAGIEVFSRNIPLPLKIVGNLMSKLQNCTV